MSFVFISNGKVAKIDHNMAGEEAAIEARTYQAVIEIPEGESLPEVGWDFENGKAVNPYSESKKVTKLKFLERFTQAELIAIEAFSEGSGVNNLAVRIALRKQSMATFIDLSLPETISGTMALAALGLVTPERVNEILNNPVQEVERYKG